MKKKSKSRFVQEMYDFKSNGPSLNYREAIWQYLIDHSAVMKDGKLSFLILGIKDSTDFWYRVYAREKGGKRIDLGAVTQEMKLRRESKQLKKQEYITSLYDRYYDKRRKYAESHPFLKYLVWTQKKLKRFLIPEMSVREMKIWLEHQERK